MGTRAPVATRLGACNALGKRHEHHIPHPPRPRLAPRSSFPDPRARRLRAPQPALRRTRRQGAPTPAVRRATALDDRLGHAVCPARGPRPGCPGDRCGRPHPDRFLPGRHRRHVRPRAGAGGCRAAGPGHARLHHHAGHGRRVCGRCGAGRALRPAAVAVRHERHRRQPLHRALDPRRHRAPEAAGVQRLLPRHDRRRVRGPGRRPAHPTEQPAGPGAQPAGAHGGGRVQRPARAGSRAGGGRRGLRAGRAGHDQHRHGAARARLLGCRAGPDPPPRCPAGRRRNPHHQHRPRRLHPGPWPEARRPGARQTGGRRRALRRLRHERRAGRSER